MIADKSAPPCRERMILSAVVTRLPSTRRSKPTPPHSRRSRLVDCAVQPLRERQYNPALECRNTQWQYQERECPSPYDDKHHEPRPALALDVSRPYNDQADGNNCQRNNT